MRVIEKVVTVLAIAAAGYWRREARSSSQAEIDATIATIHTQLATDEYADEDVLVARGVLARAETPPTPTERWFWHAAVTGGAFDPRFGMRGVRHAQGWARSRASASRDQAEAFEMLEESEHDCSF